MSARERERLKVLHEVEQAHLRQVDAAHRLRLSARQVRRLLVAAYPREIAGWCMACAGVPPPARIINNSQFFGEMPTVPRGTGPRRINFVLIAPDQPEFSLAGVPAVRYRKMTDSR